MTRVAIGICACQRPEGLANIWQDIKQFSVTDPYVFVSVDGPDVATVLTVKKYDMPALVSFRVGIAMNKNRILNVLKDYDFAFIVEDDVRILKKGWDAAYIDLWQQTGIQHFNFQPSYKHKPRYRRRLKRIATTEPSLPPHLIVTGSLRRPNGAVMAMSGKAIETVGGFCNDFNPYGYEHVDWSLRAQRAGLVTHDHAIRSVSFGENDDYMRVCWDTPPLHSVAELRSAANNARAVYWRRKRQKPLYEPIVCDTQDRECASVAYSEEPVHV